MWIMNTGNLQKGRAALRLVTVAFTVLIASLFFLGVVYADDPITNYDFVATSGTFTPLSGGTPITLDSGNMDDGWTNDLPIGFDFVYEGNTYNNFGVSTNGWITISNGGTGITSSNLSNFFNELQNGRFVTRPMFAPLWDDIDATSGTLSYQLSGAAGSQVLTVEWLNMEWNSFATDPAISVQVKLYEGSNQIEYVYRQETGTLNSPTATIGMTGLISGTFLSLNDSSTAPIASSAVETNTIAIKPATGQIYRFSPPNACGFQARNGAFTPLSGATFVTLESGDPDDGYANSLPIGFDFVYEGNTYTHFGVSTNGWISIGNGSTNILNAKNINDPGELGSGTIARPMFAALWDDLDLMTFGGTLSYQLSGAAGSQVLTVEWLNAEWRFPATDPGISVQLKLYEDGNWIEFVYQEEAGTLDIPTATIGITGLMTGTFTSLSDSSAAPTASTTVETNTIATKPATGQIYRFCREPNIVVAGNAQEIADGDTSPSSTDHTDFGSSPTSVNRTFTISNTGYSALTVDTISLSGDFSVTQQPTSPIPIDGSTTFEVTYTPSGGGTTSAEVSITSNDVDKAPYTFTIQGTSALTSIYLPLLMK